MPIARPPFRVLAVWTLAAALSACGGDGGGVDSTGAAASTTPAAGGTTAGSASGGGTSGSGAAGTTGAGGSGSGTNSSSGAGTPTAGSGTTTAGSGGATGAAGAGSAGSSGTAAVPAAGTLQTSIQPTSYPSGSPGANALAAVNSARQAAGAGLLNQSAQLDVAAAAHAGYLQSNIGSTGHTEDPAKISFFEVSPPSRIAKAGFVAGGSAEAISNSGTVLGADCAQKLLNSLYNAVALLGPSTYVGFGFGTNFAATPFCVSVLATLSSDLYGQVAGAGSMMTFPYDGQTGVVEAFDVNSESPRPSLTLFPNSVAGRAVIVNVRNADFLNLLAAGTLDAVVTRFELVDGGGNLVPAAILANPSLRAGPGLTLNADTDLLTGAAVLIPLAPLAPAQTYTATFSATLKAGGPVLGKTWSFTTR